MSLLSSISKDLKTKYAKTNPLIINTLKKPDIKAISSGSVLVDSITGFDGFAPHGHVIELFGANTSGKTTLALQTCAQAQKDGLDVIYVDAESVMDITYAESLGVKVKSDSFLLVQPTNGEEFDELLAVLVKNLESKEFKKKNKLGLIVVDSVATLKPQAQIDGSKQLGLHASMWADMSIKIKNLAFLHKISFLMVNQLRHAPSIKSGFTPDGVLDGAQNNDMGTENTTGGEALKFLYSVRYQLKGFAQIKEETEDFLSGEVDSVRIGNKIKVTTIKNKLSPPMVSTPMAILYGKGTQDAYIFEDLMKKRGFITSQGTYLKYECLDKSLQPNPEGNAKGQYKGFIYGKAKFLDWFRSPEIQADVETRYKQMVADARNKKSIDVVELENSEAAETESLSFDIEDTSEE